MKNPNEKTSDYLLDLTPERDPVVTEMEEMARERDFPIVGPLVGRILYQLTRIMGAIKVFEMGSGCRGRDRSRYERYPGIHARGR